MISNGDDIGRLKGDARFLKSIIFPYDKIPLTKIEKMRDEIYEAELIDVYSVEKGIFIQHPKWTKYQKLRADRIKASEYPDIPSDIGQTHDGQLPAQVKGSQGKGSQEKEREVQEGKENQAENSQPSVKDQLMQGYNSWTGKGFSDTVSPLPANGEALEADRSTAPHLNNLRHHE
jgi:hypothetical protein